MNPFYSNGVDGTRGRYSFPASKPRQLAESILRFGLESRRLEDIRLSIEGFPGAPVSMSGVPIVSTGDSKLPNLSIDPRNIGETGWGVIFAAGVDPEVQEALEPLLSHRRRQAGAGDSLYKEISGDAGFQAGDSKESFLARHDLGSGPVVPRRLPYYLLIVGNPESIPFEFQYQLGVQYAVGRLHFESPGDYASYAESVVAYETYQDGPDTSARLTCLGAENPGDLVTRQLNRYLLEPLAQKLREARPLWEYEVHLGDQASKARLNETLDLKRASEILIVGCHGLAFPAGHPRQLSCQGALLCSDWPGPQKQMGEISPEHYFAAHDIAPSSSFGGLVAFLISCFSAGSPSWDDFLLPEADGKLQRLAPKAFVARLPQRLLANPGGGALAVLGHVEKLWNWSYQSPGTQAPQSQVFESTLLGIMDGFPVGHALKYFNQRHAELAVDLLEQIKHWRRGGSVNNLTLSHLWTAVVDARNYLLMGDPAVCLKETSPK